MLGFSRLGKKGNLGNQLFQIASTIGIARASNQPYCFPKWKYTSYFVNSLPVGDSEQFLRYYEEQFNYYPILLLKGDYDLLGYFQTEKYFDVPYTKEFFTFNDVFINSITKKSAVFNDPNNILISIRRGDFVHHPWFYQLSYKYYLKALLYHFPEWRSRNLVFTSDDAEYCKYHFSSLENAYFIDNLNDIEQLAFASRCRDFVISNSTFSWWMAWLGEKENSKIIRPLHYFRGRHAKQTQEEDYFPDRWIPFDPKQINLSISWFKLMLKGEFYRFSHSVIFYAAKAWDKLIRAKKS